MKGEICGYTHCLFLHVKLIHDFNNNKNYYYIYRMMSIELPRLTKRNGTLYAHVFLSKAKETLRTEDKWTQLLTDTETVYTLIPMSIYKEPEYKIFQLLENEENVKEKNVEKPVTHVKAVLPVSMLTEPLHLSQYNMPSDIYQYIRLNQCSIIIETMKIVKKYLMIKISDQALCQTLFHYNANSFF